MKYRKVTKLSDVDRTVYMSEQFIDYIMARQSSKCRRGLTRIDLPEWLIVQLYNDFVQGVPAYEAA